MQEPLEYPNDDLLKDEWLNSWKTWWAFLDNVTRQQVDSNELRCPDPNSYQEMIKVKTN
jgi:hypothetical protein